MKLNISYNNSHIYESTLTFFFKMCNLDAECIELVTLYKSNHYLEHMNKDNHMFLPCLESDKVYTVYYKDVAIHIHETTTDEMFVATRAKHIMNKKTLHLEIETEDMEYINNLCEDIHQFMKNDYKQIESEHICHYIFTDFQDWEKNDFYLKRKTETLYLPNNVKKDLFDDVNNFYYNEKVCSFYTQMNIPQTRIYLFYGHPGTGKTTTSFVIASYLNLNICSLDFTNKINDLVLRKSIKNIPENSIFLIEDIDHIFAPKKSHDDMRHSITFSGLLNMLDGICKVKKLITIITCNDINALEKTVLRRIDYSVEFKNIVTEDQLRGFCERIPFEIDIPKFCQFFKNKETTMNVIQKWVLCNLDKLLKKEIVITDIMDSFNEFNKWYHTSHGSKDLYN